MASNKNQHFVPRCHLRPFTKDEAGVTITLFNIDRKKFIEQAPVKHQCAGDYFYGKDELLEKAIQSVEGAYGSVLRAVGRPRYSLTEADAMVLKRFWLLQYIRTEAASKRSVEMAKAADLMVGAEVFSFRFGIREAVRSAMRFYAHSMDSIDDMKLCLVKNRSKIPFITSDNPAIATNRWYFEDRRVVGRSFGLQASGLLALMPLTPKVLCIAYDGDVYSVSHECGWTNINNESEIRALNQHQFLNCFANIFIHNMACAADIQSQYEECISNRLTTQHVVRYAVLDYRNNGYSRYRVVPPSEDTQEEEALIHTEVLFPKPSRWPSMLRWRHCGVVYTNDPGLKYIRKRYALSSLSHPPFWKESAR